MSVFCILYSEFFILYSVFYSIRKGDILTDTTGLCNYMAFELAELAAENLFQVSSLGEEASYPVSRPGEGSP